MMSESLNTGITILVIMGVAGSGKTKVGKLLAGKLKCPFYDADDFHTPENIEKMRRGDSLTDDDRRPWLESLKELIDDQGEHLVLACSALKKSYRDFLKKDNPGVQFIYLKGSKAVLEERLKERMGHFAGVDILESQLETLEEPENALTEEIERSPELIVDDIVGRLFDE